MLISSTTRSGCLATICSRNSPGFLCILSSLSLDKVFQGPTPVREGHYSLQLPPGWEYKASWINYPEVKATEAGNTQVERAVSDVKAIRKASVARTCLVGPRFFVPATAVLAIASARHRA
jgi:hypothetical protein